MTNEQLIYYFKHPDELGKHTISDLYYLVNEYPYFQSIQLLYLKNLQNIGDLKYHAILNKSALYASDRSHLQDLIDIPPKTKTEEITNSKANNRLTEITDYKLLESENNDNQAVPTLIHQDLIDKFISNNPRIHPVGEIESEKIVIPEIQEDSDVGSSIFTESLAKIYIKQKQYTKALHIFEKLNLKYPEKSTYFADQIRFLNKIIQNNK